MSDPDYSSPFILCSSTNSIRAIMVRLVFAMRGTPKPGRPDMNWKPEFMSILPTQPDQLSEFYLCTVNPKGKVPVLVNNDLLHKPMPECIDITWYLCDWYPDLLPQQHAPVIKELVKELHRINFSALTFGAGAKVPTDLQEKAEEILRRDDISDTYRAALQHKCRGLSQWQDELTIDRVDEAKTHTRIFCSKIENLKQRFGAEYIFGHRPTALDAHVLAFLRRLHDAGQDELVPESLADWAEEFSHGEVWRGVVQSGSTM